VRARRREGVLHAQYVTGEGRDRVLPIAREYAQLYKRMVGASREEIDAAAEAIEVPARDRVAVLGLRKVLDDGCEYVGPEGVDPEEVRRELFLAAAAAYRDLDVRGELDREAVIASVGAKLGKDPAEIEAAMYADLRSAEVLAKAWDLGAEALIERYNVSLAQSLLLRATRVKVVVQGESPDRYRRLFRTMRFLGLLCRVTAQDGPGGGAVAAPESLGRGEKAPAAPRKKKAPAGEATSAKAKKKRTKKGDLDPGEPTAQAYAITIDGPFSLFGASVKYGLRLATLLHAVLACDRFHLTAEVAWGPRREVVLFHVSPKDGLVPHATELPSSSPAIDAFVSGFQKLGSAWKVAPCDRIFVVPGEAAAIPDLSFVNQRTGEEVFLEAFGFWSRAAVWTRVEQIRRGALPAPMLLAVSKELRVSSEVLEDDDAGEVYVYKATMLPRAVLERLEKRGKAA